MAIQAPPKPETRLPGEIWKAFVRSKPNDPRIEQAIDYAVKHNHPLFNTTIKTIDAAAKPDGLWDDLLAMLHEEEDHKELHTERGHADNEHENMHDASGEGKALGSILSAFKEPKFMEEDPEFWELVKKEEKAWDEKNPKPGNDATEEEKLAYEQDFVDAKYGSLDDPESTSFQKLAGEKFEEEHSGEKEKQENKTPDPKKVAKWNTYQAYRNTPISFGKDHEIGHVRHSINEEAAARLRVLQKSGLKGTDLDQSYNAVLKRIKQKHWTKFVETHQGEEGKAEAYAKEAYKNKQAQKDFDDFKKAHEAWEKEKALKATNLVAEKATKEDQTRQTPPETSPVLSEKEKLEQEFLQFKKEWAQKKETTSIIAPPQKIPAHPLYKTTPGQPSILPQVKPILPPAKNMPSQGIIRPGANASSVPPQQNLRPSQGQTRTPGFRFSLPRLRIPSNRNPVMSPQPRQP
nr:hypothetical protein [Candidatus Levybacteria bacterium]